MEVQLNYWAILVAALSTFLIGGLWYSPAVFGKAWMRENGFSEEDMKKGNMAKIFGLAFLLGVISAVNLAMFMGPENDPTMGALWGFLAGAGWVATFVGTHYLFERKSFTLFLINAGYSVVALTIMGIILAAWK
jgi:drug/metabolite transporter (DMT)-like permease